MGFQRSVGCFLALLATFIVKAAHAHSGGFVIDMMQYHHVNSPYRKADLTLEQRVEIAVKSSLARGLHFHNLIYGETTGSGNDTVFTSPLYSIQGSYVMSITFGTPARTFIAVADTGSNLVWIQCATCQTCFPQPDLIFNPAASSSYSTIPCTGNAFCVQTNQSCSIAGTCLYRARYGDGSTTRGDLAYETLTLNTTSGTTQAFPNFAFGCGHNNTGFENNTIDGLVGLGQGNVSLVTQIGSQIGNVFSYCLVDFYSAINRTSPLLLGSAGPVALQYTPLLNNSVYPGFYYVDLVGITIDDIPLQYPAAAFELTSNGTGGLVLDSGTTLTLLDSRAYTPLLDRLSSLITYPQVNGSDAGLDLCYRLAGISNPTFPSVVLEFRNVSVVLPPNNVFLQVDELEDVCLAFQSSDFGLSIFGNVAQQNFQIAYDRANKRVGFAPTTC